MIGRNYSRQAPSQQLKKLRTHRHQPERSFHSYRGIAVYITPTVNV